VLPIFEVEDVDGVVNEVGLESVVLLVGGREGGRGVDLQEPPEPEEWVKNGGDLRFKCGALTL
jgi:hypothetical protein